MLWLPSMYLFLDGHYFMVIVYLPNKTYPLKYSLVSKILSFTLLYAFIDIHDIYWLLSHQTIHQFAASKYDLFAIMIIKIKLKYLLIIEYLTK